jgi:dynein heavy chain
MLVGMGGIGKRTIARFSGFVADMQVFEPQPTKEYKMNEFRNEIRPLVKIADVSMKQLSSF